MSESEDKKEDPGYCGLGDFTTGDWDPFFQSGDCPTHDQRLEKQRAGEQTASRWVTARDFVGGTMKTGAIGLYAFVAAPFYAIIGGVVGFIRGKSQTSINYDE